MGCREFVEDKASVNRWRGGERGRGGIDEYVLC